MSRRGCGGKEEVQSLKPFRHPRPLNSVVGPAGIRVSVPRATHHLFSFPFQLFCGRTKKCTLLWVKFCLAGIGVAKLLKRRYRLQGRPLSAVNTRRDCGKIFLFMRRSSIPRADVGGELLYRNSFYTRRKWKARFQ
jgi:hypothetical protein